MSIITKLNNLISGIQSVKNNLTLHLQNKGIAIPRNVKLKDFANLIDKINANDSSDNSISTSSLFSIAQITNYIKQSDSFRDISQIVISGMSGDNEYVSDLSNLNGTYTVTEQTQTLTSYDRVYKNTNSNLEIKSGIIINPNTWEDTLGWTINYQGYTFGFVGEQPNSGQWSNPDFGMNINITMTKTYTDYPAQQQLIQGKTITSYQTQHQIRSYETENQLTTFSNTETDIVQNNVYLVSNNTIIKQLYDKIEGIPTNGIIFCICNGVVKLGTATVDNTQNTPTPTISSVSGGNVVRLQNSYLTTNIPTTTFQNDFTLMARIKLANANTRQALFASSDSDYQIGIETIGGTWNMWAGVNYEWSILQSDSEYTNITNSEYGRGNIAVTPNEFQTITLTKKSGIWSLYVDENLSIRRERYGRSIGASGVMNINRWGNGDMVSSDMEIQFFKVFNKALSHTQILDMLNEKVYISKTSNSSSSISSSQSILNDKYYRYVNIDDNMYDGDYYPTQVTHDGQVVYQQQGGNFYMIFMYNSYMNNYFWCIVPLSDYEDIIGGKTYADYVDGVGDVPGNKSSMTDNTSVTPADVIWGNGDYSCTQLTISN